MALEAGGDSAGDVAARDGIEQQIADIWRQLLGVPVVGVNDNFFKLGGRSVMALDLVSQVRRTYNCALPLREFFRRPTVGAMAQLVRAARCRAMAEPVAVQPVVVPGPRSGTFQTSFAQESQILVCHELPSPAFPMTLFFRVSGELNYPLLRRALDEVARRHDSLRMRFPGLPGPLVTSIAAVGEFEWPCQYADITDLDAADKDRELGRLMRLFACDVDLINGPVIAALVIRVSARGWLLGISIDHLACDGISLQIVLDEIAKWYSALLTDSEPELVALPYQYQDYARAQRQFLAGPAGRELASHWIAKYERYGSVVPILDLEPEAARNPGAAGSLSFARRTLGEEFARGLAGYCRHRGVTPYVVFLSGLLQSVRRFTRGDATGVVMLESGRRWDGVAGIVGWFANALPLWADIHASADFDEVQSQVNASVWDSIANSAPDLPMARAWGRRGGPSMESASDVAAACWLPHILFTCDDMPFPVPSLRNAIVRHYSTRSGETVNNAPVVQVDIGTSGAGWIIEVSYVTEAHRAEVIASILDGMTTILQEQVKHVRSQP